MFNLESLDQDREQWFSLGGPLKGVDLKVRYASPSYGEKFRRLLLQKQIYKQTREGNELVPGRDADYILEFCRHYVTDWRGVVNGEGKAATYRPEDLTRVLKEVGSALLAVSEFISQEEMFFTSNGSGPM